MLSARPLHLTIVIARGRGRLISIVTTPVQSFQLGLFRLLLGLQLIRLRCLRTVVSNDPLSAACYEVQLRLSVAHLSGVST